MSSSSSTTPARSFSPSVHSPTPSSSSSSSSSSSPSSSTSTVRDMMFGHIELIIGPMFSGKTTELMRRVRRYTHANNKCLIIKYKQDTRYDDNQASTHDLQKAFATGCNSLADVSDAVLSSYEVIAIDEGQFFSSTIVEFADRWANEGKVIIVAALDATFERKPFGRILELIPIAEHVSKLTAVCMRCHREASFTKRIGSEQALQLIGGADKYLSTCRECFHRPANADVHTAAASSPVLASTSSSSRSPSPIVDDSSPSSPSSSVPSFACAAIASTPLDLPLSSPSPMPLSSSSPSSAFSQLPPLPSTPASSSNACASSSSPVLSSIVAPSPRGSRRLALSTRVMSHNNNNDDMQVDDSMMSIKAKVNKSVGTKRKSALISPSENRMIASE